MKTSIKTTLKKLKLLLIIAAACIGFASSASAQDSKGTEFWICVPGNYNSISPELYITGAQASTVTIDIPGLAFNQVVNVTAGGLQVVSLPGTSQVESEYIADNLGIHITATTEVTVYCMNAQTATTDAYLAFPLDAIGKDYYVMGYTRDNAFVIPVQATVVATENNTTVTITSTMTGGPFTAGVPSSVLLQQGEVYQLRSTTDAADYTGTRIVADKNISVFGGAQCTNISGTLRACDHLVEQLNPLNSWGKSFVTVPLATRLAGDVFRFMAQKAGTVVSVNGVAVATLNAGEFFETILASTSYNRITSNEPILVGQFSRSSEADGVTSDPFFSLVPPDEQFLNSYVVSAGTANIPTNFLNITSPTSNTGNVIVDGAAVSAGLWNVIPSTTFSGAQVPVTAGVHSVTSPLPIGLLVYGFGSYDSYGYLGGQSFAPIATVTSLVLTPETGSGIVGTNHCWDALVKDQFDSAVVGVRVDFNFIGSNNGSGFAYTNANGIATFCYSGANVGTDSIVANVGSINDRSAFVWTPACAAPTITCPANVSVNIASTSNHCHTPYGCNAIINYPPATASDGAVITYSQNSGTSFNGGVTIVKAYATNSCGTDSCSFTVTVVDNINPVANCRNATVTLVNGTATVTAAQVNNGSTDNCGITSMTVSPSTFNCSNIGCNRVTLTVKDAQGNTSTCCATVTVVGNAPKCTISVAACNNTNTGGDAKKIYLGYGPQSATINVSVTGGGSPYTYAWTGSFLTNTSGAHPVFTPTAAGTYPVSVTVTNSTGCTTTCSVTFCVLDIRVPGTSGSGQKVYLCHAQNCSPTTYTLLVSQVASHIGCHSNDRLGRCNQSCGSARMANAGEMLIDDENSGMEMVVYPNPFSSSFHIRFENMSDEKINVRLFNLAGQTIQMLTDQLPGQEIELGSDLGAGIYFLEVQQGDFKKVVKVNKAD